MLLIVLQGFQVRKCWARNKPNAHSEWRTHAYKYATDLMVQNEIGSNILIKAVNGPNYHQVVRCICIATQRGELLISLNRRQDKGIEITMRCENRFSRVCH